MRKNALQMRKKWQRRKSKRNPVLEAILEAEFEYREARAALRRVINAAKARAWAELTAAINEDPWGLSYRLFLKRLRRVLPSLSEVLAPEILERTIDRLFPKDNTWDQERTEEILPLLDDDELLNWRCTE